MNFPHALILASKSPRRQQLLREAGFQFTTVALEVDESFPADLPVAKVARYLAEKKARAYDGDLGESVSITADTVVIIEEQILGKPAYDKEAVEMLRRLSGKVHQVITGVCLRYKHHFHSFNDVTEVYFKNLSEEEIDYYVDHYQPFDKAGAYGIQEWMGMIGITKIEGSYFNVVGLPVHKVYEALKLKQYE